jgi:DNA-directed RNA polymerase subunit M/transcription elongation factor TFIIS
MKKAKYFCPKCKSAQYLEYSPIMSRTLQCHKCGAEFVAAPSRPKRKVSRKERFQRALAACNDCGKDMSIRAEKCPNCGAPAPNARSAQRIKWHENAAAALLAAAIPVVIGLGFVHVITGSSLSVPRIVRKSSFGYSETIIDIGKITGMPWVFAKSKYPIGCRVLQDKGHIESDEAFERRIERKFAQLSR